MMLSMRVAIYINMWQINVFYKELITIRQIHI